MNIEAKVLLILLGVPKSKVRKWIQQGLIVKAAGNGEKLSLKDTFSKDSVTIRTAFLLATNGQNGTNLTNVFNNALGADDGILENLLQKQSRLDIIKTIAQNHNLKYDLRKAALFSN